MKMYQVIIQGPIISNSTQHMYDYFGIDAASPKKLKVQLEKAKGAPIEVYISSTGGDVFAGIEMFGELKNHRGKVTVKILSLAASAASVIAMAGDELLMSPGAQLMIHNVSTTSKGDSNAMQHTKEILDNANQSIAAVYRHKTGKTVDEILSLMNKETWLTAEQAISHGFADNLLFLSKQDEAKKRLDLLKLKQDEAVIKNINAMA